MSRSHGYAVEDENRLRHYRGCRCQAGSPERQCIGGMPLDGPLSEQEAHLYAERIERDTGRACSVVEIRMF